MSLLVPPHEPPPCVPRRAVLRSAAALAGFLALPVTARAQQPLASPAFWDLPRTLWLRRAATGEEIRETYFSNGRLQTRGYDRVCVLLRDVRTGQAVQMHAVLLDILRGMQGWLEGYGYPRPIIVNSGYRSRGTNAMTEGAALGSMHLRGRAADIRVPGVPTDYLARLGLYLSGGGVGFYPAKGFVHVDSGRLRAWRG